MAVDPTNPSNALAVAIDSSSANTGPDPYQVVRMYRSSDGAQTWSDWGPLRYGDGPGLSFSTDPVAIFTRTGTAYVTSLARPPSGPGIYVHRSNDGGATWGLPTRAVASQNDPSATTCWGLDKEWLSADNAGVLYLAYSEGRYACQSPAPDPLGLNYLTGSQGWSLKLTKSFDDGATWTTPTMIWDDYGLGAIPRIAPDGTLYVAFWATTLVPGRVCPPGVYSALGAALFKSNGPFDAIVVATSHDGGQTWGYHQEGQCTHILGSVTKNVSYLGGGFQPGASVDASTGVAYLVYPDFLVEQNRFTLKVISSADDGATWRAPVELTPGTDDSQQPAIHAANGVVRIAYAITRDSDRTGDAAYTESIDRGATWTAPLLLTSEPWQIPREPGSVTDLGDYHGLDLAGGRIVAVWTDARNGSPTEIWSRTGTVP